LNATQDTSQPSGPRAALLIAIVAVIAFAGVTERPMTPTQAAAERELFATRFKIEELRAATEEYRRDHGTWPGSVPNVGPPGAMQVPSSPFWLERQLTLASDAGGAVVPRSEPDYPYGPYLLGGLPVNPINALADVRVLAPGEAMPASPDGESGWIYSPTSGEWRANSAGASAAGISWFDL